MIEDLAFNQISFIPVQIPADWHLSQSKELVEFLARYSHSLFLLDQAVWDSPFFSFAAGFAFGKHVSTSILLMPGFRVESCWPDSAHIFEDIPSLLNYYTLEYQRHHIWLRQQWARKELETRGKELSSYTLLEAVEEGDPVTMGLFLESGYSPDFTDKKGVPLLCLAIRKNHPSVVRELVDRGADLNLQSRDRGNTALMDAAAEGHLEMVKLLLDHGAQVDAVSKSGQTALILAAGQGLSEICRILLAAGADPDKPDLLGMSARLYAGLFKNQEVKKLFLP